MARASANRKPAFWWQALLILLPVAVLAAAGFLSLRQDKVLAQHEAAERAQAIAEELVPKLWQGLAELNATQRNGLPAFEVADDGRLIFPPPYEPVPVPAAFNLAGLTGEQAQLWFLAQSADADEHGAAKAAEAYHRFIALAPPEEFAAAARYALGLLLLEQGESRQAAEMFEMVVQKHPDAVGETGLPLRPLAELKLLELSMPGGAVMPNAGISFEGFCSNIVCHPSSLTPYLLGAVSELAPTAIARQECQTWRERWQENEATRELYSAARPLLQPAASLIGGLLQVEPQRGSDNGEWEKKYPGLQAESSPSDQVSRRVFWFETPAIRYRSLGKVVLSRTVKPLSKHPWDSVASAAVEIEERTCLAIRYEDSPGKRRYVCFGESELGSRVTALVAAAKQIPDYFGVGVEVAGKKLVRFAPDVQLWWESYYWSRSGGQVKKEYGGAATESLGSAAQAEEGANLLKVKVYLTSPTVLFKRQRARTFWFGSLIGTSALAALAGLFAAWRAFHRQQQLSELKSNFVSSVSHELRAPIASVRLLAESLERGKISEAPKQHEYYRFIVQECRRLSSLIENVLDFSRIEQGRKQYEFEPTDIVALTEQTVRLMQPYAAERQIKLVLWGGDGPSPPRELKTERQPFLDGKAIQQALVNLIDNAIKHSPGGETVTVGLELAGRVASPSPIGWERAGEVRVWVEDHGAGIPAGEHKKIFERFYRRGSELRRETQGVGIGLSLVKHIVEAHGGRVLVRSEVGQGSRFTIELPGSILVAPSAASGLRC
jgi:signal transduction histidine kinase/tetratricopeptide (TPR) repeat protein